MAATGFLFLSLMSLSLLHSPSPASAFNYADALAKSILFFEGQRSGKLPANQRVTWRGDSGLSDGSSCNVDLVGGYYDAGDNVKFGLPMAFTTTMLAWSIIEFGGLMHGELGNAKAALRWGTDYLLKAATAAPDALYVQVIDEDVGRGMGCCGKHPRLTPFPCVAGRGSEPGSPMLGETGRHGHPPQRLQGDEPKPRLRRRGRDRRRAGGGFHCLQGFRPSIFFQFTPHCHPTSWLHQASQDVSFMSYIESNGHTLGAEDDDYSFSWDDKRVGTKILLSKVVTMKSSFDSVPFLLAKRRERLNPLGSISAQGFLQKGIEVLQLYKAHSDNYICSLVPGTSSFQAQYTPGGLLYKESGSNLQYVTSTAFLLLTYAKYLDSNGGSVLCGTSKVAAADLVSVAKKQVDYILGNNPARMSYMVGFGSRYPQHVHHRGSSLPSVRAHPGRIACSEGFQYLYSGSPNPNVLVGAVLGGPDSQDRFADDRNNYQQSEPATYINAPMVGALAFFAGTPM
ncbi:hypothetical protein GW17_00015596 [Ensete ventricosum]|nr:hypothetical protein GW17_00015596 [Ensete ventricosum]